MFVLSCFFGLFCFFVTFFETPTLFRTKHSNDFFFVGYLPTVWTSRQLRYTECS